MCIQVLKKKAASASDNDNSIFKAGLLQCLGIIRSERLGWHSNHEYECSWATCFCVADVAARGGQMILESVVSEVKVPFQTAGQVAARAALTCEGPPLCCRC